MFFLITGCLLLWGCDDGFTSHPSGLSYKFIVKNEALTPEDGEYLMLNLKAITLWNDSTIFNTADLGTLYPVRHDSYMLKVGLDNPMEEIFHLMSLGDSLVMVLQAKELWKTTFAASLPRDLRGRRKIRWRFQASYFTARLGTKTAHSLATEGFE